MEKPVVVCIGTTSVSGDSLGPLVADFLKEKHKVNAFVYGGTAKPVNGVNYEMYCEFIKERHSSSFVVAVDASVGDAKDVGRIKYSADGVRAGGALNRGFERIGDLGILGVVCEKESNNLTALMNVEYRFVEKLAVRIADRIANLVNSISLEA